VAWCQLAFNLTVELVPATAWPDGDDVSINVGDTRAAEHAGGGGTLPSNGGGVDVPASNGNRWPAPPAGSTTSTMRCAAQRRSTPDDRRYLAGLTVNCN
jgi:hypothetical protein